MASDDVTTKLQDELDCLRSRVKDLETDNAKLVAQLSNCRCRQLVKEIDGNASGKLVGKRREQKPESVRHLNTNHHRSKRYVALSVMYFGKRFYGFASEAQMEPTVESEIFKALEKTRLLVGGRKESRYSRCGRTDRGVSAVGQVIALYLRSNLKETGDNGLTSEEEIDYVRLLNRVLPNDIRIIGWCLAPLDFHARFSCLGREYKYFFWSENLNLSVMQTAGVKFLGEHDFRNFCKMDAMNVHNYKRHVTSFEVIPCPQRFESNELWAIKIRGSAFLWHQVRCMVAVLLMIGRGLESPNIIDALLDIEKTPRKPQYNMASEIPLVLHSCEFENIQFIISPDARQALQSHLKTECQSQMLQVAIFQEALHSSSTAADGGRSPKCGQMKKPSHIPLMSRAVEPSYEERRAKLNSGILKKEISGLSLAVGTTEEG